MPISVTITSVAGIPVTPGQSSVDISNCLANPTGPWMVSGQVGAGATSVRYSVNYGGSLTTTPAGSLFNFSLTKATHIPVNNSYYLLVEALGPTDYGTDPITIVQNGLNYSGPVPPVPPPAA